MKQQKPVTKKGTITMAQARAAVDKYLKRQGKR
jgi:hypothetical protein